MRQPRIEGHPACSSNLCKPVHPNFNSLVQNIFVDVKCPRGSALAWAAAPPLQCGGSGAVAAASALFDLAVCCRCGHLFLLLASCLPAPCRCLSMDYTLPACLPVALQLQPCLPAEQASLLERHKCENSIFSQKESFIGKSHCIQTYFILQIKIAVSEKCGLLLEPLWVCHLIDLQKVQFCCLIFPD